MLDFVLNFLFPPVCGICGKLDRNWICEKCKKRIEKYNKFKIVKGKKEINELFNFPNLNSYFDEFLYCFEYKSLIRNLLLRYKFSDCGYLSNLFANVILNNKKINEIFESYDIIIPVPMDKKKKAIRGYNQTELIAKRFEKKIKIDNKNLIKVKSTRTQSTLTADERTKNVKNVFVIKNKSDVENKNIILFDDIATTGSTINEISKILKENGAERILVLVIAKD